MTHLPDYFLIVIDIIFINCSMGFSISFVLVAFFNLVRYKVFFILILIFPFFFLTLFIVHFLVDIVLLERVVVPTALLTLPSLSTLARLSWLDGRANLDIPLLDVVCEFVFVERALVTLGPLLTTLAALTALPTFSTARFPLFLLFALPLSLLLSFSLLIVLLL